MPGLPEWPYALGGPAGSGCLRRVPEDFDVTELLDVACTGDGEHDWLYVEKRGLNTADVARGLARHAGVPVRDVGYAGLKDRRAVTRQWFSVRRPAAGGTDWRAYDREDATILETRRHRRKLRRGAHRGNRFRLVITDWQGEAAAIESRLAEIARRGVPNYFGPQRFGRDGANLRRAARYFEGARLPRPQRSLALSAARSLIFNEVLAGRVADGSWDRLVAGDIANLDGTSSVFEVGEVDAGLAARVAALDVHPTGPLWGRGKAAVDGPLDIERVAAARHPAIAAGLEQHTAAARRALRAVPRGLEWTIGDAAVEVAFELGRGSYATSVVREILDADEADQVRSNT